MVPMTSLTCVQNLRFGAEPVDCLGKARLHVHGANDVTDASWEFTLGLSLGIALGKCACVYMVPMMSLTSV
jgi:hypothetical protein